MSHFYQDKITAVCVVVQSPTLMGIFHSFIFFSKYVCIQKIPLSYAYISMHLPLFVVIASSTLKRFACPKGPIHLTLPTLSSSTNSSPSHSQALDFTDLCQVSCFACFSFFFFFLFVPLILHPKKPFQSQLSGQLPQGLILKYLDQIKIFP